MLMILIGVQCSGAAEKVPPWCTRFHRVHEGVAKGLYLHNLGEGGSGEGEEGKESCGCGCTCTCGRGDGEDCGVEGVDVEGFEENE